MKLLMISGDRTLLTKPDSPLRRTLTGLQQHFERIDLITPRQGAGSSTMILPEVYVHPSPYPLLLQPLWITRMGSRLIRAYGHEAMTVHEFPPFYNGMGARRLHKRTGIPYALEIHHVVGSPQAANAAELLGRTLSRMYLAHDARSAKAVRAVASSVSRTLVSYGIPMAKIALVPSFYLSPDLHRAGEATVTHDIVFVGRLVANKGAASLLRAVAGLPGTTLLLVGDGPLRARLEALAGRLGIADRVTFVGWLQSHGDVLKAMQSAKMLVMCSLSEGGPRVALEAMACGVPVVATKVGVMPDVIEDGVNGVFTTGESGDLREKIAAMLHDDERREAMGMAAQAVRGRFDFDTLIKGYADFLKRLA